MSDATGQTSPKGTLQWMRKISLIVYTPDQRGIELSELHVVFTVRHMILATPLTAQIRIFNLSNQTVNTLRLDEYSRVTLSAGYEGNFGIIFDGTITQKRNGKVNSSDTYFDIFASDSDLAHNWGFLNTTLAAGYTPEKLAHAIQDGLIPYDVTKVEAEFLANNQALRGRALFGKAKDVARDLAYSHNMTYQISRGTLSFQLTSAYKPGEAVVLNTDTGMIGLPEQSENGIQVRSLLNPSIGWGIRLHIAQKDIQEVVRPQSPTNPMYEKSVFPEISRDGFYKVLWVDHKGDTRGNDWYSDMTCLSINTGSVTPKTNDVLSIPIPR